MMRTDGIFSARTDPGADEKARRDAELRRRNLREAVSRLAASADFRLWLYATLDDLRYFDRDEHPVDDFGQGFRYAAHRIANRIIDSREGADMIAQMHRANIADAHRSLAKTHEQNETEN